MKFTKRIHILIISLMLAIGGFSLQAPAKASAEIIENPNLCLVSPEWTEYIKHEAEKVHETRWSQTYVPKHTEYRFKKWTREIVQNEHTEYRYKTRVWVEKYLEVKEVDGYDFVDGGTTTVRGKTVSGHWIKKAGWHEIPATILNIVWGSDGPPDSVLGNGSVNLSVYGGPSVTVQYKAYKKDFSGWTEYGPWSDWSSTKVTETDERKVETRTVKDDETYTDWVFVKWTEWGTDFNKVDTDTRKYTDRESRVVEDELAIQFYNPKGEPTLDLTEKNWTEKAPNPIGNWKLVDERDRVIKDAWVEEILHPAVWEECVNEEPNDKLITKTFQVDTYSNPSKKLAKKAAKYDNDRRLKWGEDKAHYGKSKWQIIKIALPTNAKAYEWMRAINTATTKKGIKNITSLQTVKTVKKGQKLTVAWEVKKNSWLIGRGKSKRAPQVFFARGLS